MEKSPFPFPFVCSTKIVYGAVDGELQVASVPLLSAKKCPLWSPHTITPLLETQRQCFNTVTLTK